MLPPKAPGAGGSIPCVCFGFWGWLAILGVSLCPILVWPSSLHVSHSFPVHKDTSQWM